MIVRRLAVSFWLVLLTVSLAVLPAHGQRIAKYGADFLAGGVDARALGMGGAYVAHAHEVSAGYWNPAGLSHLTYPQISYMHVERFAGAVSFDYGAVAFPVNERSTVSLSLFRSGVNDIVNTLNAWDPDRRQPRPNYESRITRFSAADWAVFFGYSRRLSEGLTVGTTFKGIRRTIGDFADAWGYSVDVGAQYRTGPYRFGVTVQDLSTMLQSWSINPDAFRVDCVEERGPNGEPVEYFDACRTEDGSLIEGNAGRFEAIFSQELPEGGTALVLPVVRLGSGAVWPVGPHEVAIHAGRGKPGGRLAEGVEFTQGVAKLAEPRIGMRQRLAALFVVLAHAGRGVLARQIGIGVQARVQHLQVPDVAGQQHQPQQSELTAGRRLQIER